MTNSAKGKIVKGVALTIDVAAPLAATISQFPIWVEQSAGATMSGLFLVFALLCAIPFMKVILKWLKSPSVWVLWCVLFVIFFALRNIIDQMMIICAVGAIANVIGMFIYKVGEGLDPPEKTKED